jgi:hypothetical protein
VSPLVAVLRDGVENTVFIRQGAELLPRKLRRLVAGG